MDIATCVNELDASTIQDVKKIQNTIYPGTYNICNIQNSENGKREFKYILWYLETVLKDLWVDNKFV